MPFVSLCIDLTTSLLTGSHVKTRCTARMNPAGLVGWVSEFPTYEARAARRTRRRRARSTGAPRVASARPCSQRRHPPRQRWTTASASGTTRRLRRGALGPSLTKTPCTDWTLNDRACWTPQTLRSCLSSCAQREPAWCSIGTDTGRRGYQTLRVSHLHRIWSRRSLDPAVQVFVCSSQESSCSTRHRVLHRGALHHLPERVSAPLQRRARARVACTEALPVRWIGGGSGSKWLSARQRWSHGRPTHVGGHIASGPVPRADLLSRLDHATRRRGEDLRRQ